jgi:hypothetical protein
MFKGILLGAGFSYDLGMPLASELTEVFLGIFVKEKAMIFAEKISKKHPYSKDRPINREAIFEGMNLLLDYKANGGKNYEEFLSKLQNLAQVPCKTQPYRDSYHYLCSIFYEIIHQILTHYQIESYLMIYHKNLKWFSNLKNILSEKETWVFTLNHDLYMECLAIDLKIPITYGDSEQILFPISNVNMGSKITFTCSDRNCLATESSGFFKNTAGINLVKIHGGLSELEYKDRKIICNQTLLKNSSWQIMQDFNNINKMAYYHNYLLVPSGGKDRVITNLNGELDIICKSMLTGGNKYRVTTNEKKGEEKLKLFDNMLIKLDELAIIGYGFGDPHINYRISNAMVKNDNLKLRIIDPIHKPKPEFLRQFDYDDRIRVAMCGAAHWIDYSATRKWNEAQINGLKKNENYRQKIKEKVESIVFQ